MPTITDIDTTQADFQEGLLTDVEADAGGYLRLADTDVLSFDGNDYVDCGNAAVFDITDELTIEAHGYLNQINDGTWRTISTKGSDTTYQLRKAGSVSENSAQFLIETAGGWDNLYSTTLLDAVTYYHIAATYNSSTGDMKIYINGVLDASKTHSSPGAIVTNTTNLFIGKRADDTQYWDGIISEYRIWDTVRTQQEIQANMNKRLTGTEPGLVAYYKLDEGTGTVATDSAGANDGTINGATWVLNEPLYFMNSAEDNNRLSPQLDLSAVGTVETSSISWVETLNGQTITIETRVSTDNGSTWTAWAAATSGAAISDLPTGTDVSTALLECRQSLSTSDPTVTPQLDSLTVEIASYVTTNLPTDVTDSSATLNGTLNTLSGNPSVDVYFEWGTTISYGNTTTAQTLNATGPFSDSISGLTTDQIYHYRAVVTDGVDTWYGSDVQFIASDEGNTFFMFPF